MARTAVSQPRSAARHQTYSLYKPFSNTNRLRAADSPTLNFGTSDFSIAILFKDERVDRVTRPVLAKSDTIFATSAFPSWHLSWATSPNDLIWEMCDGTTRANVRFDVGEHIPWRWLGITRSGNAVQLWLDGVFVKTGTSAVFAANFTNTLSLTFGASSSVVPTISAQGRYARAHIWNGVALNSTEWLSLVNEDILPQEGSLALSYDFKEGPNDTTVIDQSGNNNHGTITGAMEWHVHDTPYKRREVQRHFSYSLDFDGVNDDVSFGDIYDQNGSTPFSMGAWVNFHTFSNLVAGAAPIWDKFAAQGFRMFANSGHKLVLQLRDSTVTTQSLITVGAPFQPNRWYHTVAVFDTGNLLLYINGDLAAQANFSLPDIGNTTQQLLLGQAPNNGTFFNGKITHAGFWDNKALSDEEVMAWYADGVVPSGASIYCPFTEGSGTTLGDTAGAAEDGTISGATWTADTPFKTPSAIASARAVTS